MNIMIVEDNKKVRDSLVRLLESFDYDTNIVENFENTAEEVLQSNTDLVLLDLNLPFLDGFGVCKAIRKKSDIPIIILTSRSEETDELIGMNFGADDFITKPYNPSILLAHISAVLKRYAAPKTGREIIEYKGVIIDKARSSISAGVQSIELTKNEMKILCYLISQKGNVALRNDIIEELWINDEFVDDNTLTVNINRMRRKFESIGKGDYIRTKRGYGYWI